MREYLNAGLLDEMEIHVIPIILGGGVRLFDELGQQIELEKTRVIDTPRATHLQYRVLR
jgi:dihydrofolate reductase